MRCLAFLSVLLLAGLLLLGIANASNPVNARERTVTKTMSSSLYGELDVSKSSPKDILDHFGLGQAVGSVAIMLDGADKMFAYATDNRHFVMVNEVLDALKQSYLVMISKVREVPQMPQTIDTDIIDTVMDVWLTQFKEAIRRNPKVDLGKVESFVHDYAETAFQGMGDLYKKSYGMGISLTWPMVFMVTDMFIRKLNTNVIDRDMFKDVLDVPEHLKQFLYNTLAEIMSGDYAHFVQMGATFLSTIDLKKFFRSDKDEL